MLYSVSIARKASIQIIEVADWYLDQQPGLEVKFIKAIDSAINHIQKNPLICQMRYKNVRVSFLLKKFPFGIHYIVEDNHISIIAVFHTSQDSEINY